MAEINPTLANRASYNSATTPAPANGESDSSTGFWGDDGFSFGDILDLLNPLQHLPIVGTLYRAATGDQISNGSSILGGGLFGGIIGAGVAVVNTIIEETTGGEIFDHITALFDGDPATDDAAQATALASAEDRINNSYAFSRRALEAGSIDTLSNKTLVAAAQPVTTEPHYAASVAFGKRSQEATMTTPAWTPAAPAAPTLKLASAVIVEPTAAMPAVPVQTVPALQETSLMTSQTPAWLAGTPRAETSFNDTAMRYMTPQAGLQLVQAMAQARDNAASGKSLNIPLDAIERYNFQAAKSMTAEPEKINILY